MGSLKFVDVLLSAILVMSINHYSSASETSFLYQGTLIDAGQPVTGSVNASFRLYDAAVGGAQVGPEISRVVESVDGLINESLDFGSVAWTLNQARWLEIQIESDILGRQELHPTPFAINTRGISVNAANEVGIQSSDPTSTLQLGSILDSKDHWLTIATQGGNQFRAGFKLRHDSDAVGWTIESDERTPGLYVRSLLSGSTNARLFVSPSNGNVGIGTDSPDSKVDIRQDANGSTGLSVTNTGMGIGIGIDGQVDGGIGVRGIANAEAGTNYGVYGEAQSPNSWGVFSNGRIGATGTKSFAIDHPLHPEEWVLLHYSSESPEPLNSYSGTVELNMYGEAVVQLPHYFESINTKFRYQLTAIGAPAPSLHVSKRVEGNAFEIAGGQAGLEVSWEVTATRNDRFMRQMGAPVEVQKPVEQRGKYLAPQLFETAE